MPYLPAPEGLNQAFLDLDALRCGQGEAPWRVGVIATPGLRAVLLGWPPGFATVPHRHPRADEIFMVVEGRALFTIGDAMERSIGPGELAFAARGERHAIRVPDEGPELVLLAAVAPNEDTPDEAVE